jgi:cytidylate kinase
MPTNDCLTYLRAIIAKDLDAQRYQSGKKPVEPPVPVVITISRDYGSGGEAIGESLSHCLGIPLYDRDILRLIAERSKTTELHVEPHDETVTSGLTAFIFSTITGTTSHMAIYRRVLYDVVTDLAKRDAILIGRGAHLILHSSKVFRIRVIASPENCAERVAQDEGIDVKAAERKLREVNTQRHRNIQLLFSEHYKECSLENPHNFDLVINTDRLPPDQAAPMILMGLRQMGFDLYREHDKA